MPRTLHQPATHGPASDVRRVLLVEDNHSDARWMRKLWVDARQPAELVHATTLREALGYLDEAAVDLVLLDLTLPDSRGLDTLETLRKAAPGIPTLVLTAVNPPQMEAKAKTAGAVGFLAKSRLTSKRLAEAVDAALTGQS